MKKKCWAAVLEAPGKVSLQEFTVPSPGSPDALLAVELVGVCSTDVKIYHGKIKDYPLPLIMGHEIVGRIAAIGKEAALAYGVEEGDRVVLEASTSCGTCEPCLTGNYRFCLRPKGYGLKTPCNVPPYLWGGYSQYMYIAPGSIVRKIGEGVPAEAAALVTGVIGNGVQWVCLLGRVIVGDVVVVQGMGVQGLGAIVAAREAGAAKIYVTGLNSDRERFALAASLGADAYLNVEEGGVVERVQEETKGRMADLVVDVTGSPAGFGLTLELVRKQGTVVLGGLIGGGTMVPVLIDRIVQKEIRVQGVRSKGYQSTIAAVRIVESGKYPLERLVTHRFPLRQAEYALQAAGGNIAGLRPLKVVLDPWQGEDFE